MSFKIYSLQKPPFGFIHAVIITTEYKNTGGYPKAEYFLVYLNDTSEVISKDLRLIDPTSAASFNIKFNPDFMLGCALEAALERFAEDNPDNQKMNLKESDITLIESLCIKRRGNHLFSSIDELTEHRGLAGELCSIVGTQTKLTYVPKSDF